MFAVNDRTETRNGLVQVARLAVVNREDGILPFGQNIFRNVHCSILAHYRNFLPNFVDDVLIRIFLYDVVHAFENDYTNRLGKRSNGVKSLVGTLSLLRYLILHLVHILFGFCLRYWLDFTIDFGFCQYMAGACGIIGV